MTSIHFTTNEEEDSGSTDITALHSAFPQLGSAPNFFFFFFTDQK